MAVNRGIERNVLVVDDDFDVRSSCAAVLRTAGYCVREAEDGYAAIEGLRSGDIGVVILDVNMPRLDGLALLDEVDDLPPVILMTEREYDFDVIARRSKVSLYVAKPVAPDDLIEAVAHLLSSARGD